MSYRDLGAAFERIERLERENALLRLRESGRAEGRVLDRFVQCVLLATALALALLAWLVAS